MPSVGIHIHFLKFSIDRLNRRFKLGGRRGGCFSNGSVSGNGIVCSNLDGGGESELGADTQDGADSDSVTLWLESGDGGWTTMTGTVLLTHWALSLTRRRCDARSNNTPDSGVNSDLTWSFLTHFLQPSSCGSGRISLLEEAM